MSGCVRHPELCCSLSRSHGNAIVTNPLLSGPRGSQPRQDSLPNKGNLCVPSFPVRPVPASGGLFLWQLVCGRVIIKTPFHHPIPLLPSSSHVSPYYGAEPERTAEHDETCPVLTVFTHNASDTQRVGVHTSKFSSSWTLSGVLQFGSLQTLSTWNSADPSGEGLSAPGLPPPHLQLPGARPVFLTHSL